MNKKQIIELLEKEYLKEYQEFDAKNEAAIQERKKATKTADPVDAAFYANYAKQYQAEAQTHASITCKLAEILAEINGTSQDTEAQRLHNNFDLWRD